MNSSLRYKPYLNTKIMSLMKGAVDEKQPTLITRLLVYGVNENGQIYLKLPFKSFKNYFPKSTEGDFQQISNIATDNIVKSIQSNVNADSSRNIMFHINKSTFIQDVMLNNGSVKINNENGGTHKDNIVIDYSSPNIAKPFHMGHLRSTIIGNFIANLYENLGHKVTRITYLGDWGTQFGLLQIGLNKLSITNADIKRDPINELYSAYVAGNAQAQAEEEAAAMARKIFSTLESGGNPQIMERWNMIREATKVELTKTYKRLGVSFDEYHWESMYNLKACAPILQVMEANGLLKEDDDGKKVTALEGGRNVALLKSDGSTLYLTRDIAAALDRWVTLRFNRMLYVVDNAQTDHFSALKQVLRKLDYDWADGVEHIKFGRIVGLSTRKGQGVFLKDIMDEAKSRMAEKQRQSSTTKNCSEEVSDILGVSAIIVNDLKQKRTRDYNFDWNSALQMDGDCGVKLQYTHCRLCSLEQGCGVSLPNHCEPSLLDESEAIALVVEIARLEEAVERAHSKLEAYEIVNYLFKLCNKTSQALKVLQVKGQPADVAEQRLLLFHRARVTLNTGMKLLGLQPLTSM